MQAYSSDMVQHPYLHITALTKNPKLPYIIFVHGGPGLNSAVLEYLLVHEGIFASLEYNVILYDQRGCGRSKPSSSVSHSDNVGDLAAVSELLTQKSLYNIAAIIGHSYGAKLLYDFIQQHDCTIPAIFIASCASILTPRINNLLLDLAYLKQVDKQLYKDCLEEFEDFNYAKLWNVTEKLADVFHSNANRVNYYWANLDWQTKVQDLGLQLQLPLNKAVFTSVRKDLYSNLDNYCLDINLVSQTQLLWINGFHDIINGTQADFENNKNICIFYKSAHYPHIEENAKFCQVVNNFLSSTRS